MLDTVLHNLQHSSDLMKIWFVLCCLPALASLRVFVFAANVARRKDPAHYSRKGFVVAVLVGVAFIAASVWLVYASFGNG